MIILLEQHGLRLEITADAAPHRELPSRSARAAPAIAGAEGYRLVIEPEGIRVTGQRPGLFYGMQTLTQLLPVKLGRRSNCPRSTSRTNRASAIAELLLDVGRHYFSVAFVKKFLDLAAQYKINRFHWHLTDDQGWRIEIKKYPKLTATKCMWSADGDAAFVGFYTQEQIKDIVAYAQARFITVVPEIEMPGHSGAALAAYPGTRMRAVRSGRRVLSQAGNLHFLENVLSEVITLFPGPYVHIGSDEVEKEAGGGVRRRRPSSRGKD